jgi:hypothetical protein
VEGSAANRLQSGNAASRLGEVLTAVALPTMKLVAPKEGRPRADIEPEPDGLPVLRLRCCRKQGSDGSDPVRSEVPQLDVDMSASESGLLLLRKNGIANAT